MTTTAQDMGKALTEKLAAIEELMIIANRNPSSIPQAWRDQMASILKEFSTVPYVGKHQR